MRSMGSPVRFSAMWALLAALVCCAVLAAPTVARADSNTDYTLAVGQAQTHDLAGWSDNRAQAVFQAKAGMSYRVRLTGRDSNPCDIELALCDGSGALLQDRYVRGAGSGFAYASPSVDQTMSVIVLALTNRYYVQYDIVVEEYQPWTIEGTALDMRTGQPLPGMRVELIRTSTMAPWRTEQTTLADANGRYSFAVGMPEYWVDSTQATYLTHFTDPAGVLEGEYTGGKTDPLQAARLIYAPGAHTVIDGHLGLPWTVTSIVRDSASGASIPGAVLTIFHWSRGGWWDSVASCVADASGSVTFSDTAHAADCIRIQDPSGRHPDQYLGGKFDIFDSTLLQPTAGTTWTSDITATAGVTLSGRTISRSTGEPMPGVTVEAWRNIRLYGWVLAGSAVTSADGSYSMGVLPGPYRIRAVGLDGSYPDQWNGGSASRDTAADLLVPATTGSTCDFRLSSDTLPPVTTATVPAGWNKGQATVTLSAQDAGDGVQQTLYRLPSDTTARVYTGAITISTSGQHQVTFWSIDQAGNTEAEHIVSVWVDADAPDVTTDATARYGGEAVVRLSAADADSGVANIAWRVDGGGWTTDPRSVISVTVSDPGLHSLDYRSTDLAGNQCTAGTVFFAVDDYQSGATCTIAAPPTVVPYGGTASVTGTLAVALGAPTGLVVQLERSTDGKTFQSTGTTAPLGATGVFRLSATLTRNYYLRVRSIETSEVAAAFSSPVLVRAKASIPRPIAPSTTYSWRTIKVSGTLLPSRASGNRVIKIRCFRYEHGTWVWHRSVWASSRAGKTASSYTAYLRLSRGTWRVCARHEDSSHYLTDSPYRSVKVR